MSLTAMALDRLQQVLEEAVTLARANSEGQPAAYIPELARVPLEQTSAAVALCHGPCLLAGEAAQHRVTLQSVAKLILLAGFLEEAGEEQVFSWINAEPSGLPFSSATQLDIFGPVPANPLVNAGAILLCSRLPGSLGKGKAWMRHWSSRLLGAGIDINTKVFQSEMRTGDRNRALAYLMKSNGVLEGEVEHALELYFYLCSLEASVAEVVHLPMVLANGGCSAKEERLLAERTVAILVAIMATSGLYDESGLHLVRTGLPAKSGVSGLIVAVATGCAGIAVASPRINAKGGSVRGHLMLAYLSRELGWHFAFAQNRKERCLRAPMP